ncbi:MAG: 4-alpha-glucanotransferase [Mediterranea sp.]|jgi:4-alpha-glucanotransferase|nr:4-alpha-glucanotransferase [Mediterranea sp.]
MILDFHIEYFTRWSEEVRVSGNLPELGNNLPDKAVPLHTSDGVQWELTLEVRVPTGTLVQYVYHIYRNGIEMRAEWNALPRIFRCCDTQQIYHLQDYWRDLPKLSHLYTSAFTDVLSAHRVRDAVPTRYSRGVCFKVYAPAVDSNHAVGICGNISALGEWDINRPLLMSDTDFPEWQAEIEADSSHLSVEYKFVLYNKVEKRVVAWEERSGNRRIELPPASEHETQVIAHSEIDFPLPCPKEAGVAIPVFSLRSESSFGIGDFGDLRRMVDWAVLTGLKIIQILPVNDTTRTHTWTDSYPYNAISIYALHPIYADLKQMGKLKNEEEQRHFDTLQSTLNALPALDYERVERTKWDFFRRLYAQEGEQTLATEKFLHFFETNKEWLQPYAAFCYLRDSYQTADFRQWHHNKVYSQEEIEALCETRSPQYDDIAFHYFIQYHLHRQLSATCRYARLHGIVLKGDIPIGISKDSVEAWKEPHYFNMNGQAGAPPDDFAIDGQNWGFPTYNWEVMAQDGYAWWMKRFRKMAEYFDAYRIDHILGFFRIWEIPVGESGLQGEFVPALPLTPQEIEEYGVHTLNGELFLPDHRIAECYHPAIAARRSDAYQALSKTEKEAFDRLYEEFFYQRHNDFWRDEAMKKLPALTQSTRMLACGEDLGMIPACVPQVMNELHILTLEIQRMPKDPSQTFGIPAKYPYLSVNTFSTHDMSTLRGWWEEDAAQTLRFYNDVLGQPGTPPAVATTEICEQILRMNLAGNSLFCIFSLQDWLSIDGQLRNPDTAAERINVPSDSRNYWRYRMHLTLEQLMAADEWNEKIRQLIKEGTMSASLQP